MQSTQTSVDVSSNVQLQYLKGNICFETQRFRIRIFPFCCFGKNFGLVYFKNTKCVSFGLNTYFMH